MDTEKLRRSDGIQMALKPTVGSRLIFHDINSVKERDHTCLSLVGLHQLRKHISRLLSPKERAFP